MDLDSLDLDPNERILLVTAPPPDVIRRLAARLEDGIVVLLAEGEELYRLRRELASIENVLVAPGSAEDIPWKDEFFSLVVDQPGNRAPSEAAQAETVRALVPGGRLLRGDIFVRKDAHSRPQ